VASTSALRASGFELPGLAADDVDDLVDPVDEQVPHRQDVVEALLERQGAPWAERVPGPGDGLAHLRRSVLGQVGQHLARAGVEGVEAGPWFSRQSTP
jgi:hypothetical protein